MFTGLIEATGLAGSVETKSGGSLVRIDCDSAFLSDVSEGDSIAVNGVCSTALSLTATSFLVDYLPETLSKTTVSSLKEGDTLNLEKAMTLSDRLGGHYVTGHVDTVGRVVRCEKAEPWGEFEVSFDREWLPFVVHKGSITIEGISLTISDLKENHLTCSIIPHTFEKTNLGCKIPGEGVNLEFDLYGKYIYRFHQLDQAKA